MALKRTSEPFIISTSVDESAANTFTQAQVSVNLNPLDQEVLLVLAADIDAFAPDVVAGTKDLVEPRYNNFDHKGRIVKNFQGQIDLTIRSPSSCNDLTPIATTTAAAVVLDSILLP